MDDPRHLLPPQAAIRDIAAIDRAIVALAERQHGVISRAQLLDLGLSRHEIQQRIGRTLHRLYRGVYALGHRRLTPEARYMAAVLAAGPAAVLSHAAAADLLGLRASRPGRIDVTVPNNRRGQTGLRLHREPVAETETTTRLGIPVTTAARTIVDLAATMNEAQLEDLIRKAEYANATTRRSLMKSLNDHPNRRGATKLRRAIAKAQAGKGIARSELEKAFRSFLRKHKLPAPDFNAAIHLPDRTYEVDCLYAGEKLAIELDGRNAHLTAAAFEEDRARDAALTTAGYRVIRTTWRQLRDDPTTIAAQLTQLLSPSAGAPPPSGA